MPSSFFLTFKQVIYINCLYAAFSDVNNKLVRTDNLFQGSDALWQTMRNWYLKRKTSWIK